MKKIILLLTALTVVFTLGFGMGNMAFAETTSGDGGALDLLGQTKIGGSQSATEAGNQLPVIIGNLVRAVLGLLGIILVVLMLYAGFMWMTARGEAERVEKAKSTITRAIIGAVIILSAYAITGFVINAIINSSK